MRTWVQPNGYPMVEIRPTCGNAAHGRSSSNTVRAAIMFGNLAKISGGLRSGRKRGGQAPSDRMVRSHLETRSHLAAAGPPFVCEGCCRAVRHAADRHGFPLRFCPKWKSVSLRGHRLAVDVWRMTPCGAARCKPTGTSTSILPEVETGVTSLSAAILDVRSLSPRRSAMCVKHLSHPRGPAVGTCCSGAGRACRHQMVVGGGAPPLGRGVHVVDKRGRGHRPLPHLHAGNRYLLPRGGAHMPPRLGRKVPALFACCLLRAQRTAHDAG